MLKPLPLSIGLLAGANSHRYSQQPSPFATAIAISQQPGRPSYGQEPL
jgi:hypothetical protein